MKTLTVKILRFVLLISTLCFYTPGQAQFATWDNGGGDGLWNTDLNWDTDLTPGVGTNAVINPGFTVNYNTPMTATAFGAFTNDATVFNVNASGFNCDAIVMVHSNGFPLLFINSGGAVNVAGNFSLSSNTFCSVSPGGSLTVGGELQVGAGTNYSTGFSSGGTAGSTGSLTNLGGTITAANTFVNRANASANSRLIIQGGVNNLGNVIVTRASGNPPPALGTEGLVINGGLIRMNSLDLGGIGNSWQTLFMTDGIVTNSGPFTIRSINTAARGSRFIQNGGLFVSTDAGGVNLKGSNAAVLLHYAVLGGTNLVERFVLSDVPNGFSNGVVNMTNQGKIYIGSGGIVTNGQLATTNIVLNAGGIFGAQADWTGDAPIRMAGGSFDAAALDGTPHNIAISGALYGAGGLTKTGGGVLTLGASNTYAGNTLINGGRLALGANGSLASSLITTASNTVFDVSAVSGGYTLGDSRTIGGFGVVTGNVALASNSKVDPGNSAGTLTFTNNLTASGGAIFHFDLNTNPNSSSNDFLIVGGTLTVSGVNTLEAAGTGPIGTVYPLIRYGTFSGSPANFDVSIANGIISNNATTKTLYLVVQAVSRAPTNIVWTGLTSQGSGNLWDSETTTNWVTEAGGSPTLFIAGDHPKFTNVGAGIQTNITLVGILTPGSSSVTVNSTANYTFGGSGRIGGAGSLTKTNTGKLTILTTNSYSGPTTIGGGVLEATLLDNGSANSSIGAASTDPTNIVLSGGTLRYSGSSVGIDRGATVAGVGGAIDITNAVTTLTINGTIAGDGVLTKTGAGALTLTAGNSYSGGTAITAGTNRLNAPTSAGTNTITLAGGTLHLAAPADSDFPNPIVVTAVSGLAMAGSNNRVNGSVSGSQTINVSIEVATNSVLTFNGDLTNYTGTFYLGNSIGVFRFNSGGGNSTFGCPNATIDLGTSNATLQARNSGTMSVGALQGGPDTFVKGQGSGTGSLFWEIGAKNLDTTFAGTITNASAGATAGLIKVGTGILRLTGINTYTGSTIISSGTLQVDGALDNTVIDVNSGGTLSGNGFIIGLISANTGSTVAPGASVGTLSLTNGGMLINGSTLAIEINKSLPLTNDSLNVTNCSITAFSGSITVTNLGPALTAGDTFFICNQTIGGGSALIITGGGAGVTWTNKLEVDGSIAVLTAPAVVNPVISSVTKSGNNFIFNGSNGPTSGSFIVLSSTNVATPVASWTPIATNPFNPNGTFSFTNAISLTIQKTFYRVQVQ